jgi:two-component system sensor histidine kinase DesK
MGDVQKEGGAQRRDSDQARRAESSSLVAVPADAYRGIVSNMAPRLAYGILAAVFTAIALVSFISVLATTSGFAQIALSTAYLAALLGLQFSYFSRPRTRFRPSLTYPALLAQAALVYLPLLQFGDSWVGLPGILAGSVLLALRPAASLPLFGAIVASMGVTGVVSGRDFMTTSHLVISAIITGLLVYGLTRLVRLVTELDAARGELAQLAVAEERLRFARDVHDLLGLSLSAITLKSELTNKLITEHPDRAREEVVEILEISRKALADARSVASGYRELSLDSECRAARSVLTAADVDVRIERDCGELPNVIATTFATVLREGVTNVLRHSKAEKCEITVRKVGDLARMDIVNDGLTEDCADLTPIEGSGNGIRNLSHRVRRLGGGLTAGVEPGEKYRLRVSVPLKPNSYNE